MSAQPGERWTTADARRDISQQTADWDAVWAGETYDHNLWPEEVQPSWDEL